MSSSGTTHAPAVAEHRGYDESPQPYGYGTDPVVAPLLDQWLADREADMVALRRHIHANPELSGCEFQTAARVVEELTRAGLSPRLLPKRNGVICDIGTGDEAIAIRADLDALPLRDVKDVPYRSTVENACHACGHDVHTTVATGAGLVLAELVKRGQLRGRVRLLFQPAEERIPSGAPEVIAADGLVGVKAIFGLHCAPHVPCGSVAVRTGPLTSAADFVEVRVRGDGGHSARAHMTADVVHAVSRIIVGAPALLSRRVDTRAGAALVFGAVAAGENAHTVPTEATLRGTVRVLDQSAWRQFPTLIPALIRDSVAGSGAEVDVNYVRGVPPVINDRWAAGIFSSAASVALGGWEKVAEADVSMGGEDFAFYLEHIPGAMIRLGVAPPGLERTYDIHQAVFDVDERAIAVGIRVMVHTALAALAHPSFN